jgi:hypothetical protein
VRVRACMHACVRQGACARACVTVRAYVRVEARGVRVRFARARSRSGGPRIVARAERKNGRTARVHAGSEPRPGAVRRALVRVCVTVRPRVRACARACVTVRATRCGGPRWSSTSRHKTAGGGRGRRRPPALQWRAPPQWRPTDSESRANRTVSTATGRRAARSPAPPAGKSASPSRGSPNDPGIGLSGQMFDQLSNA